MASAEQIYKDKNAYLGEWLTEISSKDFYMDIFPPEDIERRGHAEDRKPNPIIALTDVSKRDGKKKSYIHNEIVFSDFEALDKAQGNSFALCSMCSYSGRKRSANNAYKLHGICIDLDGVGMEELKLFRAHVEHKMIPWPTYIVNSGHGLHVYYVFFEPVPLYPHVVSHLQLLKEGLTRIVWNKETSNYSVKDRQFQGIYQGFRMVGTCSKLGRTKKAKQNYLVTAFKCAKKVDLMYLNEFVYDEYKIPSEMDLYGSGIWGDEHLSLDKARELYPKWYEKRIIQKKAKGQWYCNEGLYYWWLNKIRTPGNAKDGNRYNCIAVLFIMAIKCGIEIDVPMEDALDLVETFNELTRKENNEFTADDVIEASKYYDSDYAYYSIKAIETRTGIRIDRRPNRKPREQHEHLRRARLLRSLSSYDNAGRPSGTGTAQNTVFEWRKNNPEGRKADCVRATGLDKKTVYKWWDSK